MFELVERDGFARIGRFDTLQGTVETPALLPVVHPDPARQRLSPKEMEDSWGVHAIITSSYILYRNALLKERARERGLHGLLGFSGTIMTDSGAFQQHVYGDVAVAPEEILTYQNEIGSDIATVLDLFLEPESCRQDAEEGVAETLVRAEASRRLRGENLLAVPIQGGLFPDLRERSASGSATLADILCVGGIVPLLESYRFADFARVLLALRHSLPPEKPLHLFGMGHPMLFALGTLLGGDIFDTASYHKFAMRDSLLFPDGSLPLSSIKEEICGCSLCGHTPLTRVAELPARERELHLTRHNLAQCLQEMARVRQAIRNGRLWELVERRASSHPALRAALKEITANPEVFLPVEPPSRRSLPILTEFSLHRPAVVRFQRVLTEYLRGRDVGELASTPLGSVPIELCDVYPVGCLVTPEQFSNDRMPPGVPPFVSPLPPLGQALGIVEWCWGRRVREELALRPVALRHSPSSGRLREISIEGHVLFVVGNDGLPHPTFSGGALLHRLLPHPSLRVVANRDAAPFVAEGRSLFSRHVEGVDPAVVPEQHVLVVDPDDRFLGVGRALLAAHEMGKFLRGVAVKITSHSDTEKGRAGNAPTQ